MSGSGSNKVMLSETMSSQESARLSRYHHNQISKDDILMSHSHSKEKVKANPYATIKMWRPTSSENSIISGASAEDFYQSFTNLNPFQNTDTNQDFKKGRQPPSDDLKNSNKLELSSRRSQHENFSFDERNDLSQDQTRSKTNLNNHKAIKHEISNSNGFEELPAHYSADSSPLLTKANFRDKLSDDSSLPKKVTNGNSTNFPPSPLASSNFLHSPSQMSPFIPSLKFPQSPSLSVKEQKDNASYQIVSDGTTNSVKLVLSHNYTDIDLVSMDLERLLAELKLTMESLKTSHGEKNTAQLSVCVSELHSQTKLFIQEAKLVVSSANNSHDKMVSQLRSAVHTLSYVFLHGQATMLLMKSSDQALQLGFQIIKAVNSFKSTINATNLALGKTLNDPNMKYLMRQAQNLAALLASLVNIIKEIEIK